MIRAYILMGFTFFLMHLHTSGNISKYINMKYSYLSLSAMVAAGALTVVQFIIVAKEDKEGGQHGHGCSHHDCGHHHSKEDTWYKKLFVYAIMIYPIVSGIFFPIATLNSNIVKAKGFHFPTYNEGKGDPYAKPQFLRPDTSGYFGKEAYADLMNKEKKAYIDKNTIVLDDKNYLKGMETIYNFPGEFDDKTIQFKGFVYNDPSTKKSQIFVFRFGIIHCVADSGVFGMLADMPEGTKLKNDEWVIIKGKLSEMYYAPFKMDIPYVQVDQWQRTSPPKDQYVYRGY
ncbi:TIGR03943 family putative permease subunit [Fictibacillus gelatini]|uniref:TIGR03943 family putative permease subunit n=1 Tax=Fictibacillus gelatini TaxID=225985 RepID=UPI0004795A55|nr:TIGR03943 family protein [Fictibacillus gelatini]